MNGQNTGPDERPKALNPIGQKGYTGNPGGRPRKLREIEAMLDEEHRTVENMRPVFARLKFLALGEPVEVTFRGAVVRIELKADAAFMSLYLDRVLGPMARGQIDLSDAPQEVVDYLAHKLH